MKKCKFKLSREQVSTLYHIFKRCGHFEPSDYEEALVFSVLAKLSENLGVKLMEADKKKFGITLNATQALAVLVYINWNISEIDTSTYHGILLHNMRNHIHQTFPLKINS